MRQRVLSWTAGDLQKPPFRAFAPQRGLAIIGTMFRMWALVI
jgi:hypothetical protein